MKAGDWLDADRLGEGVIVVGLGGNIGGVEAVRQRMERVLAKLAERWGNCCCSAFYQSAPVGAVAEQADFVNAVAAFRPDSPLAAEVALFTLQELELAEGRLRSAVGGPRTLDLDLLLVGNETRTHEALQLPHPRMHERAFVLAPLRDLFGEDFAWNGRERLGDLLRRASGQRLSRLES